MHEHSHSNQRSKTHILARSPPTQLPPPLWPGPLVRFVLCTHIDSLWTGFSIGGPSSIFLGVNLVAHQGDSRRRGPHGHSSVPPAGFFSFFKTRTCSARGRPPRPHHRALPPSASGPSPAARHSCLYPCSATSSSLDVCGCACCDICGLSADAAARSAAAVARLAQPHIKFFGFYENSTKNQGGGTSGPVVQNLW